MIWSFSYNSFEKIVTLSHGLLITQSIPMDPKDSVIKGPQCISAIIPVQNFNLCSLKHQKKLFDRTDKFS